MLSRSRLPYRRSDNPVFQANINACAHPSRQSGYEYPWVSGQEEPAALTIATFTIVLSDERLQLPSPDDDPNKDRAVGGTEVCNPMTQALSMPLHQPDTLGRQYLVRVQIGTVACGTAGLSNSS